MPMVDLTMSTAALEPRALAIAVEAITTALIRAEGAPDNEVTRALTWVMVHEVDRVNVGGQPSASAVYRAIVTVPAGTALHGPGPGACSARKTLVRDVTDALLAAEGGVPEPADAARVYCIIQEVTDGYWGGLGTTFRMEDIAVAADAGPPAAAGDDVITQSIGKLYAGSEHARAMSA
jgi:phenylpyruvate tautomerase PptA (4-oxalocrotonate tautomerase family)